MALVRIGDLIHDKASSYRVVDIRDQGNTGKVRIARLACVMGPYEDDKNMSIEAIKDFIREGVLRIDLADRIRRKLQNI